MAKIMWQPSDRQVQDAHMTRFRRLAEANSGLSLPDYDALHAWSTERLEDFWKLVWDYCEVIAQRRGDTALVGRALMPGAKWFPDARLNFAENLLRHQGKRDAIVAWNEQGCQKRVSFDDLRRQVDALTIALGNLGLKPGDRVAAVLPNIPEAIVAMLAVTRLGGIWSSCSPDFSTTGILDRFGQIEPTVLIGADAALYKGKIHRTAPTLAEVAQSLPSLKQVVTIPDLFPRQSLGIPREVCWEDLLASGTGAAPAFERFPFDHPIYILFTSGTTGRPKCLVHGAGGTLLQHLKEHVLHTNLGPTDRIIYYSTCGWMMWNWMASALASGCTVALLDGFSLANEGRILFDLAEAESLSVLGTSASHLAHVQKLGVVPRQTHDLRSLRTILSTGSPLLPESFDYVYEQVKEDVQLSSISGGTDIVSCFALGNPVMPVYRGELQCRGLGMSVRVFDEHANSVTGERGELVCTAPFPSMPVRLWNDTSGEIYRRSYFRRFPGVWCHGDFAELTDRNSMLIYGRSDTVLNPGGVRIGTAEIYRPLAEITEVLESVVVGHEWEHDQRIVLFVRVREGNVLDDALREKLKGAIRQSASPRHVPAMILAVNDIPRTLSGKISEVAVREAIHGRPIKNVESLANPGSLEEYQRLQGRLSRPSGEI